MSTIKLMSRGGGKGRRNLRDEQRGEPGVQKDQIAKNEGNSTKGLVRTDRTVFPAKRLNLVHSLREIEIRLRKVIEEAGFARGRYFS